MSFRYKAPGIKPLDDPTRLLLRCSRWSLGHRSSDVKSSTARISSHLSNRALLCLQPVSAVVCLRHTLRFANSKQRMNKISPKPCHKKCGSANLRVCKSAGLQVCKSAVCVCRTPRQIRLQMCDTSAVKWDTEWHYLGLSTEYRANFLGIYLYFRNSDLISIGSLTHSLTLDFIYGLNNHGCDMPDVVKISLWGKLMFN